MSRNVISSLGPFDLIAAAFTVPLFSLVIAAIIVAGALVAARMRAHAGAATPSGAAATPVLARYRPERRALGIGAIIVIVSFTVEAIVRGYLLRLVDIVEWWQYATPVFAASLCLTVVLVLVTFRGTTPPEQPAFPTSRRTWLSFGPRRGLVGAGATLLALVATTVAAGMASSSDERGRFIYLELPIPNTDLDALRPWFYGWAFGMPVLVCVAVLFLVSWGTLRRNAARPYLRLSTITAERRERVDVASCTVGIATAAMLLSLGGAFRFIGRYGSTSRVTISSEGQDATYDMTWQYAEFAAAADWLAPALEITAFALLLFVAQRMLGRRARARQVEPLNLGADPAPVR